ncbi:hypothetical protein ABFT51_20190 [Paenibacillus peoriae]|uniref:hypothetical protein n=1 Tax=Paenibacillus peoriae TaxID=59893 RepID=UPI0032AF0235
MPKIKVVRNNKANVLREFGGIKYSFNRPNGDKDSFHIIPEETYGDYYEKEDFEEIEMRVNESLIAIGQARDDNMLMFMSKNHLRGVFSIISLFLINQPYESLYILLNKKVDIYLKTGKKSLRLKSLVR